MTKEQIELARHALGLGNGRKVSYRNHFVVGHGQDDYEHWQALVDAGLARKCGPNPMFGNNSCFFLTPKGATLALRRGESLNSEDFPSTIL